MSETQYGEPTLGSQYLSYSKDPRKLRIPNLGRNIGSISYHNKTQDYSLRTMNLNSYGPTLKTNTKNTRSGKISDFPPIKIQMGKDIAPNKSLSRNFNSSVESRRVSGINQNLLPVPRAYPSKEEFKNMSYFMSEAGHSELISIRENAESMGHLSQSHSEKELDTAIKDLTKHNKIFIKKGNVGLINLFKNPPDQIKDKLEKKLKVVNNLKSVNKAVKLSKRQERFLFE